MRNIGQMCCRVPVCTSDTKSWKGLLLKYFVVFLCFLIAMFLQYTVKDVKKDGGVYSRV